MPLTRRQNFAAILLAVFGLTASLSYLEWPSPLPPTSAGTLDSSRPENPVAVTTVVAPASLATLDLACQSEPLKEKLRSLRSDAAEWARRAHYFAERVQLKDANFEDASAEVTVPADAQAIAKMQADLARHNAALDRWMAEAGPVLDRDFDAFMKDLEKRCPELMVTTIPVEYEDAKRAEEKFRSDGVPATDPRRKAAQARIQLYRDQLLRYGSGLKDINAGETRYVLDHLQNPGATIAEYQTYKTQYLTTKAKAAETERRYEAARLIPLPASRTKDWRLAPSISAPSPHSPRLLP